MNLQPLAFAIFSVVFFVPAITGAEPTDRPSARDSIGRPKGAADRRRAPDKLSEGDAVIDFKLRILDSKKKVRLSSHRGKQPVALIFGSYTWPPFRRQSDVLERLYAEYGKEVQFYLVYVREAHPTDGWQSRANERDGVLFEQPKTQKARREVAETMCQRLELSLPTLIDDMDNQVAADYNALPDRLYLVGRDGKIVYKGDRGPRGFRPPELEEAIVAELARP